MAKKILITGSLGYIGSVLVPYLNGEGYNCVGYDTGFFKDCLFYKPEKYKTILKDAVEITKNDLKNIDAVVHLAGISNDPFGKLKPEKVYGPVRIHSLRLARLCKQVGVKFIFASSCSVYGKGNSKFLDEDSRVFPQTPYSDNKMEIEEGLRALTDNFFSPIILRFATAFGSSPRMRFDIVINMFAGMTYASKKIVLNSDGMAWRPYVHVLDICKAIRMALEHNTRPGSALMLNVGGDEQNVKIVNLAHMVLKHVPDSKLEFLGKNNSGEESELIRDNKIQDGKDTRTYKVSFARIQEIFPSFKCDWSIARGVDDLIQTFDHVKLTPNLLFSRKFYRLQKMEDLFRQKGLAKTYR